MLLEQARFERNVDRTIVQIGSAAALLVISRSLFEMSYDFLAYALITISVLGIIYFLCRFISQTRFAIGIANRIKGFLYGVKYG